MNRKISEEDTIVLKLGRPVSEDVASDIEKESVYVSPYLDRIRIIDEGATAILSVLDTSRTDEVVDKARRYLDAMSKHISGFEEKIVFETTREDTGPYEENVQEQLAARGWIHDYGKGRIAYSGPVLELARYINEKAGELYTTVFNAQAAHFPAFVDHDTLKRCGYIESHPTAISFVSNIVEDFDALEAYRLANSCAGDAMLPPEEHVHRDGMCLNPAACLPAYPTLEGRVIGSQGLTLSWLGRVFRYESRNVSGMERLYEFNVREVVFVGSEALVAEQRQRALPLIAELARTVDIDMTLRSATDPFFATVSAAKKFFQQAHDVKSEMMVNVIGQDGTVKRIAGGSVNLHGAFFGERFNIRTEEGEVAHTGCIGLGVERWTLAAFTQHGFDPGRWPSDVRDAIFR